MELSKKLIGYSPAKVRKELSILEKRTEDLQILLQEKNKQNQDLKRDLEYFKSREDLFKPILNQATDLSEELISRGEGEAEAIIETTRQELLSKRAEQIFLDDDIKAKKQMILEQEVLIKNDIRTKLMQLLEYLRSSDYRLLDSNIKTATSVIDELGTRLMTLTQSLERDKAEIRWKESEGESVPEFSIETKIKLKQRLRN